MTPGYLFRLYASPWKLGAWLLLSAVFVVVAYAVLSRPGSQLDFWHALAFWAFGIIFGLGVVAFGVQFVVFGVARRPMLEITHVGWTFHPFPYSVSVSRIAWSEISRVGIARLESGLAASYRLEVISRSAELRMEQQLNDDADFSPKDVTSYRERVDLTFAFTRLTPEKCRRLLERIQAACPSEIAQHAVYIEPEIWGMM